MLCLLAQLCPTLCDPMNCSPPGSSVHGILQARILEWVAMPSSRGSSQPRDQTQVSCTGGRFFTIWATREAHHLHSSQTSVCLQYVSQFSLLKKFWEIVRIHNFTILRIVKEKETPGIHKLVWQSHLGHEFSYLIKNFTTYKFQTKLLWGTT